MLVLPHRPIRSIRSAYLPTYKVYYNTPPNLEVGTYRLFVRENLLFYSAFPLAGKPSLDRVMTYHPLRPLLNTLRQQATD